MNEPPHHERLLADILAEGPAVIRRDSLLGEMLRAARRRRQVRQARRAASALALVAAGLWVIWPRVPPATIHPAPPKSYDFVQTHPLPKAALVETQPLSAASLVSSVPTKGIFTTPAGGQRVLEISDDDLLS